MSSSLGSCKDEIALLMFTFITFITLLLFLCLFLHGALISSFIHSLNEHGGLQLNKM